eukprot:scaffold11427_cov68-Phaeocystis_antarctica.AAC.1
MSDIYIPAEYQRWHVARAILEYGRTVSSRRDGACCALLEAGGGARLWLYRLRPRAAPLAPWSGAVAAHLAPWSGAAAGEPRPAPLQGGSGSPRRGRGSGRSKSDFSRWVEAGGDASRGVRPPVGTASTRRRRSRRRGPGCCAPPALRFRRGRPPLSTRAPQGGAPGRECRDERRALNLLCVGGLSSVAQGGAAGEGEGGAAVAVRDGKRALQRDGPRPRELHSLGAAQPASVDPRVRHLVDL